MFEKRKDTPPEAGPVVGRGTTERQPDGPPAAARPPIAATVATIGPTIFIKGELSGDEDVVIAGQFEGAIDLPNQSLSVIESGQVRADVKAHMVVIQGEVTGDVEGVEKVTIVRTGRMQGNIKSPRVILDDGALFKGNIDMDPPPAAAAKGVPARQQAADAGRAQGQPGQAGQPRPKESKAGPQQPRPGGA